MIHDLQQVKHERMVLKVRSILQDNDLAVVDAYLNTFFPGLITHIAQHLVRNPQVDVTFRTIATLIVFRLGAKCLHNIEDFRVSLDRIKRSALDTTASEGHQDCIHRQLDFWSDHIARSQEFTTRNVPGTL